MAYKIGIRILGLLAVVVLCDLIYRFTFYVPDLTEKSPEIVQIRKTQDTTDVYYFGESSNVTFAETDTLQETISQLTAWFFPGLKFTNINKYATHGGIYRVWLQQLRGGTGRPKAVVITLNLRSFDATWIHSKLETQLQQSLVLAKPFPPIINRFLLSLQAFDNKTDAQREEDMLREWKTKRLVFPYPFKYATIAEWDHGMSQGGFLKADKTWDLPKIELACHYIKSYAFNIDSLNPRIKDFDAIKDWCDGKGIKLYLNLMAENVQYADSLVGRELVYLMRMNRDYLVKRYHNNGCTVVDNLESVKGKDFIDQNWTTEHYNIYGRKVIAANLARALSRQFPQQYKPAF
jgi:hypothetical protein